MIPADNLPESARPDRVVRLIVLFILITVTYFTNILIFGFLGLTIGIYVLFLSFKKYSDDKNVSNAVRFCIRKLLALFIISLPGLIFSIIFYTKIRFYPSDEAYSLKELIKWITDARPLIVYSYAGEKPITRQFFHILLLLLALSFIINLKDRRKGHPVNSGPADVIAIPFILALLLFFITPNGSGAGMMSDRYCLMLYILGLTWIVARAVVSKFNNIIIILVLVLHFGLLFRHLNGAVRKLDTNAVIINNAAGYIAENSIVLPVNLSDNWLEPHFSNYLGADKPVIILENYEAGVGWFPVKWNTENIPDIMLKDKNSISGIQWITNPKSRITKQIDYVLLYGNCSKLDTPQWIELKVILSSDFKLKYKSENNYVMVYEKLQ